MIQKIYRLCTLCLILLVLSSCSSSGGKGPTPKIFYPASAINIQTTTRPRSGGEQSHERITYQTPDSPAMLVQFYVNDAQLYGWDKDVTIGIPNEVLSMSVVGHCPFWAMTVSISETPTLQHVQLDYVSSACY